MIPDPVLCIEPEPKHTDTAAALFPHPYHA